VIDVKRVAEIARIELSDEEVEKFSRELEEIDRMFSIIREIDVSNVEPAFHPIEIKNVFRDDVPGRSVDRSVVMKNVAEEENGYIKGPRIV